MLIVQDDTKATEKNMGLVCFVLLPCCNDCPFEDQEDSEAMKRNAHLYLRRRPCQGRALRAKTSVVEFCPVQSLNPFGLRCP